MAYLDRMEILIGKDKLDELKNKRVLVCGTGGVGSFVCEALARSGIGHLTIVDHDIIDDSNLNRQLMTMKDSVGKVKVEVMKERLEAISDCEVEALRCFIDDDFVIDGYDYVVDCIDSLKSKFAIVRKAQEKGIPVLCSMGSAKRMNIANIKRTTLDKTQNDPLAKAFRTLVRKEHYYRKIPVVYSDTPVIQCEKLGSSIFVVGSVGLFIASEVYKDLLGK